MTRILILGVLLLRTIPANANEFRIAGQELAQSGQCETALQLCYFTVDRCDSVIKEQNSALLEHETIRIKMRTSLERALEENSALAHKNEEIVQKGNGTIAWGFLGGAASILLLQALTHSK